LNADRVPRPAVAASTLILPLALAQFICSFAATNMNVAISTIADDLHTSVFNIQTAITLFTLTMAALMIPGSKLTDIWGRKRCFMAGLFVYGTGALLAALAPGIGLLTFGYAILEGVGSALLIPPIYILVTVMFPDVKTRAKYFGIVSGAAGLGAAAGPLIGGVVTSAISWRASFLLQVAVVAAILVLARHLVDPPRTGRVPRFDLTGAVLSALGLVFAVLGILQSRDYGWFVSRKDFKIGGTVVIPQGSISPVWIFLAVGAAFLVAFFFHIGRRERAGRDPLISPSVFRNRVSNLGLTTQTVQWLAMQGSFFVISVYLQQVWGYSAIDTGLALIPATAGILLASAAAERMARRRPQRTLIIAGFVTTLAGMVLLELLVRKDASVLRFVPGLLAVGIGVGIMLTASVNVVQSSWPEDQQGDISGVSRSVSNLGSSLGTALAGSVLVGAATLGNKAFGLALATMGVATAIGLVAAILIPRGRVPGSPLATVQPDATG
jgi:MFS family permease